jgi:hypothetical protein
MLGPVLVSVHNVRFYQRLMADLRLAIEEGRFEAFARSDPRCGLGPSAPDNVSGNDSGDETDDDLGQKGALV